MRVRYQLIYSWISQASSPSSLLLLNKWIFFIHLNRFSLPDWGIFTHCLLLIYSQKMSLSLDNKFIADVFFSLFKRLSINRASNFDFGI